MPRTPAQPRATIDVPRWAQRAADAAPDAVTLVDATIADAATLDADALRAAVRDAYRELFETLGDRHVVRAWNVLPDIHGRVGDGDRYMAFNAGRHDAMRERYGRELAARAPAASGVGGAGDDLTIALLATRGPGEPVDNPRQTPAFRYSARYGRLSPCFARATRACLSGQPWLLVSGTAAIVGEDTRGEDFRAQLALTFENLRAVLRADGGDGSLRRFVDVRAYLPPSTVNDAAARAPIGEAFARCEAIEFVSAELCRRNLLVEIEGLARSTTR